MRAFPKIPPRVFDAGAPALFVFLWSTGWISARYAADDADAMTFLTWRFAFAALAMLALVQATGAAWPATRAAAGHAMASGVLLHGIYLGGVWWALRHGMPTGISGVIAALQPILTAFLAPLLIGERISPLRWLGVALGFAGIVVVLSPKVMAAGGEALSGVLLPLAVNAVGMLAVTLGTFYQKRFIATGDLRSVTMLQYVGAFAFALPAAFFFERGVMHVTPTLVLTMVCRSSPSPSARSCCPS